MVFLVKGWSAENIEEKKKTDRRKTFKSEEKEKRRIRGKSNNNNIHLVLNSILLKIIIWKEVVYTIKFYLQFLCVAEYLKHSNDTPNLNIHKYTNYNMIELYINRLSTTRQIFIAINCLIMMSEKYFYFRKRKKHLARTFFTHPIEVTGSMYFGNIFRIMCLPKICIKT